MRKMQQPTMRDVIGARLPRMTWLSADGHWMAHLDTVADWACNAFRQRVILTDLVQQRQTCQIDEEVFASAIKWTHDCKSIGYLTTHQGRNVLGRVNCEDGSAAEVACSAGRFTDFDWHPTSSKVVIAEDAKLPVEVDNEVFSVQDEPLASASLVVVDHESGETQRFGEWDQTYSISDVSWSSSGDGILFTALPEPDTRVQWQQLLMLDPATGRLLRLIEGRRAIFFPVWSEDGSEVAFFERRQAWDDLGGAALTVMRLSDRSERVLLASAEINCRIRSWDDHRLLISGQVLNRSLDIYEVSTDSGAGTKATSGTAPLKAGASASQAGRSIAYIAYEEDRFPEVVLESRTSACRTRLTDYHSQSREWPRLTQQRVVWQGADGRSIEGVLVDARSNATTDRHPLIVLLHGGPAITIACTTFIHAYFEPRDPYPIRQWNEQGISVFMPDYRGSSGYGPEFREAIANRMGELESSDILSGLDDVLAEFGFDPGRIGVAGLSYGGYLTMLLAAKYSSRFAAASAFAGIADMRVHLYCSAGNMESYLGEDAWDPNKPGGFLSPLSYISRECPPMLLQTGDRDERVDRANSLAFSRLLRKRGGTVNLVTYKDCGHFMDHPEQLLRAQEHNLEWFTRWL